MCKSVEVKNEGRESIVHILMLETVAAFTKGGDNIMEKW